MLQHLGRNLDDDMSARGSTDVESVVLFFYFHTLPWNLNGDLGVSTTFLGMPTYETAHT